MAKRKNIEDLSREELLARYQREKESRKQWRLEHPNYQKEWDQAHPGYYVEYRKKYNLKKKAQKVIEEKRKDEEYQIAQQKKRLLELQKLREEKKETKKKYPPSKKILSPYMPQKEQYYSNPIPTIPKKIEERIQEFLKKVKE